MDNTYSTKMSELGQSSSANDWRHTRGSPPLAVCRLATSPDNVESAIGLRNPDSPLAAELRKYAPAGSSVNREGERHPCPSRVIHNQPCRPIMMQMPSWTRTKFTRGQHSPPRHQPEPRRAYSTIGCVECEVFDAAKVLASSPLGRAAVVGLRPGGPEPGAAALAPSRQLGARLRRGSQSPQREGPANILLDPGVQLR